MTNTITAKRAPEFIAFLDESDEQRTPDPKGRNPLDSDKALRLHSELLGHFENELARQSKNRRQRAKAEDYFDGIQFTHDEEAEIKERGQTPTVLNVIAPAINWMLGNERRNRSQGKVLPRRKEARQDAELKTAYIKYLDDAHYAEMVKSDAFRDAVITGLGWLETGYGESAEQEPIFQRHVAWRQMVHDSFATRRDFKDARYIFRVKWTDLGVAKQTYPDRADMIHRASIRDINGVGGIAQDIGDEVMDSWEDDTDMDNTLRSPSVIEAMRPRVRLIEAWTRQPLMTDVMVGGVFNGEIFDPNSRGHVMNVITAKATVKKRLKQRMFVHIMTSTGFVSSQPSPYRHNDFPFTPIIANRRGRDGMPYGVAESMMHLQDNINKRHIKAEYLLNANQIMAEEGFTTDQDEFVEEANHPQGVMIYKHGKKPDINSGKEMGAAHVEMMSMAIDMVQALSGITDESMGRTTNATSGKAIKARQQQGAMVTAHYYDNLRHGLQVHGEKLVCVAEQFADDEQQFRITTSRGKMEHKTINATDDEATNITLFKADFQIGEEDWKASNRQASADAFGEVIKQVAPADPAILVSVIDLFIEMLDLPYGDEIVARIRQHYNIEDPDEDPDDQSPEAVQLRQQREVMAQEQAEAAMIAKRKEAAEADMAIGKAKHATAQARKVNNEAIKANIAAKREHLLLLRDATQQAQDLKATQPLAALVDSLIADADEQIAALEDELTSVDQAEEMAAPPVPNQPNQPI